MGTTSKLEATPFHRLDLQLFFTRLLLPLVAVLFISFVLMGHLSSDSNSGVDLPPFQMARYQTFHFLADIGNMPSYCAPGASVSNLQHEQCAEYWSALFGRGLWVLFPPFVSLILLVGTFIFVQKKYRRAREIIESGRGSFAGVVTQPPLLKGDIFSHFFCFDVYSVQIANQKQIAVCIPFGGRKPKPGDKVAIAALGKLFGKDRFAGAHYTPNIAVISHLDRK